MTNQEIKEELVRTRNKINSSEAFILAIDNRTKRYGVDLATREAKVYHQEIVLNLKKREKDLKAQLKENSI